MTSRPEPLRLILAAIAVVVVVGGVVAASFVLFGPAFAQGCYLGIIVAASMVRTLPRRAQLAAALLTAVVCALATAFAGNATMTVVLLVITCAAQIPFARLCVGAVSVLPVLVAFYGIAGADASPIAVGAGTLLGAAIVLGAGAVLFRTPPQPDPASPADAITHGLLLAVGSVGLFLVALSVNVSRPHWWVLAFCLVLAVRRGPILQVVMFAAVTAAGAIVATVLGTFLPAPWLIALILVGAVATVAFTLISASAPALLSLTTTVILIASVSSPADGASGIAAQRVLAVVIAAAVAIAFGALRILIDRVFERRSVSP